MTERVYIDVHFFSLFEDLNAFYSFFTYLARDSSFLSRYKVILLSIFYPLV